MTFNERLAKLYILSPVTGWAISTILLIGTLVFVVLTLPIAIAYGLGRMLSPIHEDERGHKMHLRDATMDDAWMLFRWRTDPETQANSRQSSAIVFADHEAWLRRSLKLESRRIQIAMLEETPIGTVRTDVTPEGCELSWTVAPEHRGHRYGSLMVRTLLALEHGPMLAEIKKTNMRSIQLAISVGMHLAREDEEYAYFIRK